MIQKYEHQAVCFTQDMVRRAAGIVREAQLFGPPIDIYALAARILEAAVRNTADLRELIPPNATKGMAQQIAEQLDRTENAA